MLSTKPSLPDQRSDEEIEEEMLRQEELHLKKEEYDVRDYKYVTLASVASCAYVSAS